MGSYAALRCSLPPECSCSPERPLPAPSPSCDCPSGCMVSCSMASLQQPLVAHPMVEGTPRCRPSRCTLYRVVSCGILRLA